MADEFFSGKRVLVTGGSGVIGKELLRMLLHAGADILNIDRLPLPEGQWDGLRHSQKDLALNSLTEITEFRPQVVFHLAAEFERSAESPEFWETNWRDNVLLSHRVIDSVKSLPECEAFVFASSYLVYSPGLYISKKPTKETVLRESERVEPRNICGAAKFYTEWEMEFVREHFNPSMRTVSARIFRVYGLDSREIINRWVRSILAGRKIEVYNRQNRFDYIFSRDVAEGLLHIAVSPEARGCINLSSGYAKSIDDVLQILAKYLPETESLIIDQGVQDVFETSCGNLTLLKKMTGWNPSRSLEEGIKLIIEYEQPKKPRRVA